MRWTPGADSSDVEDRRGQTGGGGGFGGGGLRLGVGGMLVVLALSLLFRRNLFTLLDGSASGGVPTTVVGDSVASTPREDTLVQFVTFVLDTAQATWAKLLADQGTRYQDARLVLFRDGISSACGFAETASGPFYCPGDNKVYIDLGFYDELRDRFGAPGDFAQAYVLAHELGHHVQWLLGTEQRARGGNDASVRVELQADCYAGVWGHEAGREGILEMGDLQEGLAAAAAVGDDRLQRMETGRVSPESFTHGTSRERTAWFRRGFDTGRLDACDTFAGSVDIGQ
ncbi:MAG TPA: neutral zinc metallopeptidase [Gemmatimonadales bacterium]|jgi:predicted metalloprotease|nr:neutral zinc metallopeptidase [Gemmatimonadales bacterium]